MSEPKQTKESPKVFLADAVELADATISALNITQVLIKELISWLPKQDQLALAESPCLEKVCLAANTAGELANLILSESALHESHSVH